MWDNTSECSVTASPPMCFLYFQATMVRDFLWAPLRAKQFSCSALSFANLLYQPQKLQGLKKVLFFVTSDCDDSYHCLVTYTIVL